MLFLTKANWMRLPTPPQMHNHGNYVVSLGNVCRWLGKEAEALGVQIYPGFAGAEILFDDAGSVAGVATGAMGVDKAGRHTANYQEGVELHAKQTLFAEGLSRFADQGTVRAIPSARRRAAADLRYRRQGIVGGDAGAASSRPRHPHHRLAA